MVGLDVEVTELTVPVPVVCRVKTTVLEVLLDLLEVAEVFVFILLGVVDGL